MIILVCESLNKETFGDMGSELIGLYVKSIFTKESLSISRSWLALWGGVSSESDGKCIKNSENILNTMSHPLR